MQPKTKTYDARTTADNSNRNDLMLNSSPCNEMDRLTYQEKELYKALCHVSAKTLWGAAIKDCLQRFDRTGNRELFNELSMSLVSQMKDNEDLMKNIIGVKAYAILSHRRMVKQANGSLVLSNQIHSS